ncbi:hypothetical protein BP5796_01934 [Coleophoma crateriformis]|uniref:Uncharacterized protein n=1 Tax=Coleophoma crateriformis TaxID=565419 RepID=A0A3D8T1Y4_9HELO|nr:hypothetical protein BP5796_01934 [Coleophoma crateriformis]
MLPYISILLTATALADAVTTYNLTSNGCVDASGFESCQVEVTTLTAACIPRAAADHSDLAVGNPSTFLNIPRLTLGSIYDICPNTDPNLIGLSLVQQYETALNTPFSSCDPYLAEFNCVSDLGFQNVPGGKFYRQGNLPVADTDTLSNVAGTVTSPASGSVFTYTNNGDSQTYTITVVSVSARSQGTKAVGKTTATGSSDATVTNSAGVAASPTSSQAGRLALNKVLSLTLFFHFFM